MRFSVELSQHRDRPPRFHILQKGKSRIIYRLDGAQSEFSPEKLTVSSASACESVEGAMQKGWLQTCYTSLSFSGRIKHFPQVSRYCHLSWSCPSVRVELSFETFSKH